MAATFTEKELADDEIEFFSLDDQKHKDISDKIEAGCTLQELFGEASPARVNATIERYLDLLHKSLGIRVLKTVLNLCAVNESLQTMPDKASFMGQLSMRGLHALTTAAGFLHGEDLDKALDIPGIFRWVELVSPVYNLLNEKGRGNVTFGKAGKEVHDLSGKSIGKLYEQRVTIGDFKKSLEAMSGFVLCKYFVDGPGTSCV
jgi:hypothetical protein